jgi:hypothetical protein
VFTHHGAQSRGAAQTARAVGEIHRGAVDGG